MKRQKKNPIKVLTYLNVSLTLFKDLFLPFQGFLGGSVFLSLNENMHYKNEELWMKCLKAEKCFRGWVWIGIGKNIWRGICSRNVFASLNISKEMGSQDIILERCLLLRNKTPKGFSETHSIGQLNANCKIQRLVLIHFTCLEDSFKLLKIQSGSYI